MANITIGCRLPSGLIIELMKEGKRIAVELAGQRQTQARSPIILLSDEDYGVTEVDSDFWAEWKASVSPEYAPLKSGAIFEAKNVSDAAAKARDLKSSKTGHEPMPREDGAVKAA